LNPRRLWSWFRLSRLSRDDRAAQVVEFAVALPLMVVFVVGIFDFSGAFTLKQKLTNVARDAARAAAADPATDLLAPQNTATGPISVWDASQIVDNYLIANHLNECGLGATVPVYSPTLTWTFTAHTSCPGGGNLILIVNRGYYFPAAASGQPPTVSCTPVAPAGQTAVISTCVSIQYPYQWRFGRAASLLGSATALPSQVSAVAVAMNEN
jgi:Flp pilus assembly protein TadG